MGFVLEFDGAWRCFSVEFGAVFAGMETGLVAFLWRRKKLR